MKKSFLLTLSFLIVLSISKRFSKHIGHISLSNARENRKKNERNSTNMINMVDRLQNEIQEKVDDAITQIFDNIESTVTDAKNTIEDTQKIVSEKEYEVKAEYAGKLFKTITGLSVL